MRRFIHRIFTFLLTRNLLMRKNFLIILLFVCASLILEVNNAFGQIKAAFSADPLQGCAPVLVKFKDESSGNPSYWKWNLGNRTISFLSNPATTYFNPGTYTIKLVIKNASGSDSAVKTDYITIHASPVVNFFSPDTTGCYPLDAQFSDQ